MLQYHIILSTLKTHLKTLPCGKKLNHSVYITEESLQIVDEQTYKFVADLKTRKFNYDKSTNSAPKGNISVPGPS